MAYPRILAKSWPFYRKLDAKNPPKWVGFACLWWNKLNFHFWKSQDFRVAQQIWKLYFPICDPESWHLFLGAFFAESCVRGKNPNILEPRGTGPQWSGNSGIARKFPQTLKTMKRHFADSTSSKANNSKFRFGFVSPKSQFRGQMPPLWCVLLQISILSSLLGCMQVVSLVWVCGNNLW